MSCNSLWLLYAGFDTDMVTQTTIDVCIFEQNTDFVPEKFTFQK